MKLLHLLPTAFYGGPESQVFLSSRTLRSSFGAQSHFLLMPGRGQTLPHHPFAKQLLLAGFPCEFLETPLRYDLWGGLRKLARATADLRPDVLITYGYKANFMASRLTARRIWPSRRIAVLHGWTAADRKVSFFEWLEKCALRGNRLSRPFDAIVAVAESQLPVLTRLGIAETRVQWIPNALDPLELPPRLSKSELLRRIELTGGQEDPLLIGTVGRLSREKSQHDLVSAFDMFLHQVARLDRRADRYQLVIVGDGPKRASLEHLKSSSSFARQIHLVGFQPDGSRWLGAFDLLVMSSLTEAFPIVLLEAVAQNVPVVATRVGDTARLIQEDGTATGWLADPGNPGSLAEKLRQALNPEDEGAAVEREARARAARSILDTAFSPRRQGELWWKLLTSVSSMPN